MFGPGSDASSFLPLILGRFPEPNPHAEAEDLVKVSLGLYAAGSGLNSFCLLKA